MKVQFESWRLAAVEQNAKAEACLARSRERIQVRQDELHAAAKEREARIRALGIDVNSQVELKVGFRILRGSVILVDVETWRLWVRADDLNTEKHANPRLCSPFTLIVL